MPHARPFRVNDIVECVRPAGDGPDIQCGDKFRLVSKDSGYEIWNVIMVTGRRIGQAARIGRPNDTSYWKLIGTDVTGDSKGKPMSARYCISKRIRDRYVPALPYDGMLPSSTGKVRYWKSDPNMNVLSWLLIHDWTIKDAERKAMLRSIHHYEGGYSEDNAAKFASGTGHYMANSVKNCSHNEHANGCGITQYRPCAECGKMTRACEKCGKCPGCDPSVAPMSCGCCIGCVSNHGYCGSCSNTHAKSKGLGCQCKVCACGARCPGEACPSCESCEDCCHCRSCMACNRRYPSIEESEPTTEQQCDTPGRHCRACCRCAARSAESHSVKGAGKWSVTSPANRQHFPVTRLAGAEVEYNNCKDFRPILKWAKKWGADIHNDVSCGWEAVTAPAGGDYISAQLTELGVAFSQAKTAADNRCGVHVHVDASDLRWPDMARLLRLYSRLEGALYLLAGQERLGNRYCPPWKDAMVTALDSEAGKADPKGAILRVLYASGTEASAKEYQKCLWATNNEDGEKRPHKKAHYGGQRNVLRYRGLNVAPWLARLRIAQPKRAADGGKLVVHRKQLVSDATVEFRLHNNTLDPAELVPWVHTLVRVVDFANGCSDRDVADLPRSQFRALMAIAPESKEYLLRRLRLYRKTFASNARQIGYHPKLGYSIGKQDLYFATDTTLYGIVLTEPTGCRWIEASSEGCGMSATFRGMTRARRALKWLHDNGYTTDSMSIEPYVPGDIRCDFGVWNVEHERWAANARSPFKYRTVEAAMKAAEQMQGKHGIPYDVRRFDGAPILGIVNRAPTINDGAQYFLSNAWPSERGRFYSCYADTGELGFGPVIDHGSKAWAIFWARVMLNNGDTWIITPVTPAMPAATGTDGR